jgi:hypothetical protein
VVISEKASWMVETIHLATVAGLISRSNPSTIRDEEALGSINVKFKCGHNVL